MAAWSSTMSVTYNDVRDNARERWTSLSIAMHWLIVALLVAQFIEGEWMVDLFDSGPESLPDSTTVVLGYTHMIVGSLILLAALVRLWDRFAHGRPTRPSGEPGWARALSRVVHAALYTLLVAMPIVGAVAWFTGNDTLGEVHTWAWTALMVLAGTHVLGALVNQFWFKTGVLRRILPGHGRAA